ncbi:MAG: hypothetical protein HY313_04695 [Acidobacteria bacterium]|nr:hypothetical protein [Acidobacteriota bacterium]
MQMQKILAAVFLASLILGLTAPMFAQERQRRVFTNEDVERQRPAPSPSAPGASFERPADQASTGETPARTAPFSELVPQEKLKKLTELQRAFEYAMDFYTEKEEREADEILKARWHEMTLWLLGLIRDTQDTMEELQKGGTEQATRAEERTP